MRRKAMIIGSHQLPLPRLPGVAVDHASWDGFLRSNHGGAWEAHEIVHLDAAQADVSAQSVQTYGLGQEFTLVVFSGHGWHDPNRGSMVTTQDGYDLAIAALHTVADRQIVVVDACRVIEQPLQVEFRESSGALGGFVREAADYRRMCRHAYDKAVLGSHSGILELRSCSPGESSSEDQRFGGYFTHFLLDEARTMAQARQHSGGPPLAIEATRPFGRARAVLVNMTSLEPEAQRQTPVAYYGRCASVPSFPLAVG